MEGNGMYPCHTSVLYTGQNGRIADSIGSKLIPDVPLFSLQTAKKKQSVMLYLTSLCSPICRYGGGALGGMAGRFGNMTSATVMLGNAKVRHPAGVVAVYGGGAGGVGNNGESWWGRQQRGKLVGSATTGKVRNVTIYLIQPSCAKYALLPQSSNIAFSGFNMTIQLKMFTANPVRLQLLAYGVFILMQISFSLLTSTASTTPRSQRSPATSGALIALQLIPAFSIYHCLYEFASSAYDTAVMNGAGTLTWQSAQNAGFFAAVLILLIEALVFLLVGLYLDQVVAVGSSVRKHPLLGLQKLFKKGKRNDAEAGCEEEQCDGGGSGRQGQTGCGGRESPVGSLLHSDSEQLPSSPHYSIICDRLRKVYPGRDGNKQKVAVRDLSVAVARGECFGMLGPNGAGKTTTLSMMMGFLQPSEGAAIIEGMGIVDDMDAIYSIMGVCPQHDLLWEQLTGREHLLFYGRLKNLRGQELKDAVEKSLKSVNLLAGGVGDKVSGQSSGSMKRRLSVAISLIGNPLVVYMDEPSTGLDPASRKLLWDVVKKAAKKDRAIVLTTHSMEEAKALCDRLGIFVSGQLECIGNVRQLTTRYGGTYVLTVTTPLEEEENIGRVVNSICPNAKRIYSLAGTQKFEMPMAEVEVADVFATITSVRNQMSIRTWCFPNTTLKDVFIKIAKTAQATPV
ncbi:unnamed protein product [Closterium sp. Yama58-4]|nr:unnamed protein product [Closterium sp. Yama58-4]